MRRAGRTTRSLLFTLGAALALPGLAAPAVPAVSAEGAKAEPARVINGRAIADRIMVRLERDPAVPAGKLGVVVVDGDVRLTGGVPSLAASRRAERVAESVRGVRSVTNRLEVGPGAMWSDAQVARYVKQALANDPAAQDYELEVTAKNGVVTLVGSVDSPAERQLAVDIASDVFGVRAVRPRIKVTTGVERPESAILHDIEAAWRFDPHVDPAGLSVEVRDRTAVVQGEVQSAEARRRAIAAAAVVGIDEVDATLLVVSAPEEARDLQEEEEDVPERIVYPEEQPLQDHPDEAVRAAIEDRLDRHPRVDAERVEVSVEKGAVMLRGQVESLKESRSAEVVALQSEGVSVVHNRLQVDPYIDLEEDPQADEEIVDQRLPPCGDPAAYEPAVDEVAEGREELSEEAVAAERRHRQEREQRRAELTPERIDENLRQALRRDPYVSREAVEVEVVGSEVWLAGEVDSLYARMRADDIAARVRGVTRVHNDIDVTGPQATAQSPLVDDDVWYRYEWYRAQPSPTRRSDAEIASSLAEDLFWSSSLDPDRVQVQVQGGFVKLEGTVDTPAAAAAAAQDAYEAGAVWVENNLAVRGG